MKELFKEAHQLSEDLVRWRRDFHRYPELRFEEVRTAGIVAHHLEGLGVEVRTGVGQTGVVGLLTGGQPGPVLMLRFDMDALAIHENNQVEYRSVVDGVMHACGHDAHTAIGMGAATLLARRRDQLAGTIKLVFQPAEEGGLGARAMIADGVMENPKVDLAFGFHIHSQSRLGLIKLAPGPVLAAADRFKCTITGRGGHGAEPHKAVDALLAACQAVNLLQSIASRNVGPLELGVVSVGTLHAGSVFNAIAGVADFEGTIRSYNAETRALIIRRLREIVIGAAHALGAEAEVEVTPIVPALVNDPAVTAKVSALFKELLDSDNFDPDQRAVPSDDMAEFLARAQGCNFSLGAAPGENPYPHHNSRFDINEDALPIGAALMAAIALHESTAKTTGQIGPKII